MFLFFLLFWRQAPKKEEGEEAKEGEEGKEGEKEANGAVGTGEDAATAEEGRNILTIKTLIFQPLVAQFYLTL